MRSVRYIDTVVGLVPTRIVYSDYREVSGVTLPQMDFYVNGESNTELTEVRANMPIDAAKFARSSKPATPRSTTPPRRGLG